MIAEGNIYPAALRSTALNDINYGGPTWLSKLAAKVAAAPRGVPLIAGAAGYLPHESIHARSSQNNRYVILGRDEDQGAGTSRACRADGGTVRDVDSERGRGLRVSEPGRGRGSR